MTLYAEDFDTFATDIGEPDDFDRCEECGVDIDEGTVRCAMCAEAAGPSDDGDENDQPCMGEGCLNPHPDHSLAECYTLEMCEALQGPNEGSWQ